MQTCFHFKQHSHCFQVKMFLFCSCEAEGSNDAKDNDDAKENAKIVILLFVYKLIIGWNV